MKIIYTNHADENIKERELNRKVIEDIMNNPDKITDAKFGRKVAQRTVGNRLLRVVYEKENNTYIVITAYYTKPERYT